MSEGLEVSFLTFLVLFHLSFKGHGNTDRYRRPKLIEALKSHFVVQVIEFSRNQFEHGDELVVLQLSSVPTPMSTLTVA